MNINEAKFAIIQRFIDSWTATTPFASTVAMENVPFTPPSSGSWIRPTVRELGTRQHTLGRQGNRKWLRVGLLFVQVFTPSGGSSDAAPGGTKDADDIAEAVRALFEGVTLNAAAGVIHFHSAPVRPVAAQEERWFQVNVECQFDYTQTK